MDPHEHLSSVVSDGLAAKLTAHKEKEREQVEALLASQKHLTSNVRTLINSLDQVLLLSSPKFSSSQPDLLRSVVARARLLRKQLDTIGLRVQGIQAHLQGCHSAAQAACNQLTAVPQQQQQQVMPVGERQQERQLPPQHEVEQAATLPAQLQQQQQVLPQV